MNEIKIILNLPRSGGTIISKAISSQKDVVLLSEIHPDGPKIRKIMGVDPDLGDPIFQFHNWYDFIEKKEYKKDLYSDLKFLDKIKIIYQTTKDKNKTLIIRDWSFIDFFGKPYIEPSYTNTLINHLSKNFKLKKLFITRNPLETFISCVRKIPDFSKNFSFNLFLDSYEKFIKNISSENLIRYESFVENPKENLIKIGEIFNIDTNGEFDFTKNKVNITGDDEAILSDNIVKKSFPENILTKEQIAKINNNKKFNKIMKILDEYSN